MLSISCVKHLIHIILNPPSKPCKTCVMITPILQVRKLRLSEVTELEDNGARFQLHLANCSGCVFPHLPSCPFITHASKQMKT